MSQGQIIESGNHQELLERNGLYAKSWKAQMQVGSNLGVEKNLA
jgi:ATP-binding cassette subfamily B protein